MTYTETHNSVRDFSGAMMISQTETTITLINEDGFEWTDPKDRWFTVCDESHQCDDCGKCVDACICDDRDEEPDTYTSGE